ncbi:outer membrane beta-barrel protein [Bradyrhizobium sp. NP1]|uniref:outer membrane protein n=1 Tax=Bradyrhizobium sp. NP1 TaxID=3049772 RepID=UPI0025A4DE8F|nr:outer membrane beta-barrel protein [Bradyrhizobium sp. NP1]WJR81636.1 outer membrane beta-barrel protein [Bradyrhizobium sp. NP1]
MRKILLGALGLAAVSMAAPASAADLAARPYTKAPPAPIAAIYDWTGFYVGFNGGGGSSHNCATILAVGAVPLTPFAADGCRNATGGTVGGQIGYRWQMSNWVFGLEGQGNWADFTGDNIGIFTGNRNRTRIDAFGLFTGQIGYTWNNVLLYVKGGGAVVGDSFNVFAGPASIVPPPGTLLASANDTRWGGTVGAGLEFGFAPNWSVGVEYDHIFTGNRNYNFLTPGGLAFGSARITQDIDMGLVRVNYRWGGPVIAKY